MIKKPGLPRDRAFLFLAAPSDEILGGLRSNSLPWHASVARSRPNANLVVAERASHVTAICRRATVVGS